MNTMLGMAHTNSSAAVLDVIRAAGTISRVEITRATGLTGATVSTAVRRLLEDGLVVEIGRAESTGGKPRMLLRLDPDARFAIGVHLDHAGITYVVSNLGGAIVARWRKPSTDAAGPEEVVRDIAGEVSAMVARIGIDRDRILGIGVVAPGPITASVGLVLSPPGMQGWADFPLGSTLESYTGLPVLLDNDATAAASGEYWGGGLETTTAFAALYMGTGIGAGVLVNGTVYRGASSNAGEIGHICVDVRGPECWCGSRGCLEAIAGPATVIRRARELGLECLDDAANRSVADNFASIARAATRGERAAVDLLAESSEYIAIAAQTLANVLDVDLVILTGPSFAIAGSLYLPVVQERVARSYFARGNHPVHVRISSNAFEAAAVGAAALVLQSELAPRQSGLRLPEGLSHEEPAPGRALTVDVSR